MSEQVNTTPDHVTIIKESSNSGSTILVALIALLVLAAIGYFVVSAQSESSSDASVAAAADKVGAAAEQVGDAAEDAVKKIN